MFFMAIFVMIFKLIILSFDLPPCAFLPSFQLHCCGVSNFSDWQATPWGEGHGPGKMPPSCCRWTQAGVCGPRENERGIAELYSTVSIILSLCPRAWQG